jgi:hypothetical protein
MTRPKVAFGRLITFVRRDMRMSHIYQPLILGFLARAGGSATVRQLASQMAAADEASLRFWEHRLKQMPLKVLAAHGVIRCKGDLVSLIGSRLTYRQQAELAAACEARISEFVKARGEGVWSGLLEMDPVGEDLRFRVLKRDRRCVLCGNGPADAPLQVDHITPRSKGGTNDLSNLQTLCAPCNRGKSNRDSTDFRAKKSSG